MKIELTKEQYWDLMRATYMADWMANAICEADMEMDEGIKAVRNHIFSFAKEAGFEKFVGYDERIGYHATYDMDDEPTTRALIKRYDERAMWDELMDALAERDFERATTPALRAVMSHEERVERVWELEAKWSEEFEEYGVERLEVKADNEHPRV